MRTSVICALLVSVVLVGCEDSGNEASDTPSAKSRPAKEKPLAKPLEARCDQVTFANKRFPNASKKHAAQVGAALADEYRAVDTPKRELNGAFQVALLGICNKTKDPAYQPVDQVRGLADDAQRMAEESDTSFLTAFTAQVLSVRGKEQVDADADFIKSADARCQEANSKTQKLLRQASSPAEGTFRSAQAMQLAELLNGTADDLTELAASSTAKEAKIYAEEFRQQVDRVLPLAKEVGRESDQQSADNIVRMVELGGKLQTASLDAFTTLARGGSRSCSGIFG